MSILPSTLVTYFFVINHPKLTSYTGMGLFAMLARSRVHQRLSMFADDVMVFFKPSKIEARACGVVLNMFAQVSGLLVNMAKSVALPIRCSQDEMSSIYNLLGCASENFPCKYLGLHLTIRKQTTTKLPCLVDQLADSLPNWRAAMLPKSSRLFLITLVLCAIPIHSMLALDLPPKTLDAMSKNGHGFLWCGNNEANGGNHTVVWDLVCRPKWAGGLGIPNLGWLNKALPARRPCLRQTDSSRPWSEFGIDVLEESMEIFHAAVRPTMGND